MTPEQPPVPNHHAHYPGFAGPAGFLAAASMAAGGKGDARPAGRLSGLAAGDAVADIGPGPGTARRHGARPGAPGGGSRPAQRAGAQSPQTTPLCFFQDLAAGFTGLPPAHPGQPVHPPSYHQINSQTCLQTLRIFQTAILDAAAALERAVIHLDPPAPAIPTQPLAGILEALRLHRRQKHPVNRFFHPGRRVHFTRVQPP